MSSSYAAKINGAALQLKKSGIKLREFQFVLPEQAAEQENGYQ
jgi:hypothetical protein